MGSKGFISRRAKIKDEVNVFEPVISTTEGGYITEIHAGENITIRGPQETPTISAKDTTYTAGEHIEIVNGVISAVGTGAGAVDPLDASETNDLAFIQLSGTKTKEGVTGYPVTQGASSGVSIPKRKSNGNLEVGSAVALADAVNLDYLNHKLIDKQDKLTPGANVQIVDNVISAADTTYTAGDNITIDSDNRISATTGPTYTAGANVQISAGNVISATDTTYTAGDNITIVNNVISATGGGGGGVTSGHLVNNSSLVMDQSGNTLSISNVWTCNYEFYPEGEGLLCKITHDLAIPLFSPGFNLTWTENTTTGIMTANTFFSEISNYIFKPCHFTLSTQASCLPDGYEWSTGILPGTDPPEYVTGYFYKNVDTEYLGTCYLYPTGGNFYNFTPCESNIVAELKTGKVPYMPAEIANRKWSPDAALYINLYVREIQNYGAAYPMKVRSPLVASGSTTWNNYYRKPYVRLRITNWAHLFATKTT